MLRYIAVVGPALLILAACEGRQEHARNLRIPGLIVLVCNGVPYDQKLQACGQRSVWKEADWGTTAHITVYGVQSKDEAEQIAKFVEDTRSAERQQHIRVSLRIYSTPRSAGREPAATKLLDTTF
jgi:hypothetical protein